MSTHNPERRKILRDALAAGCALWLMPGVAAETATHKLSKAQAKYQEQPKGDQKCATCMHFVAASGGSCKLVEGAISANGWCMLWAKKTA